VAGAPDVDQHVAGGDRPVDAAGSGPAGPCRPRARAVPAGAVGGGVGCGVGGQAEAITQVLAGLPDDLPADTLTAGAEHLVGLAGSHNAGELRRLSRHLLDVVAPEVAEQHEADRLERELRAARKARFLEFHGDGAGSVVFRGSLPIADAEPFVRIIDAYAAAEKRGLDALDPHAEYVTPAMRRADDDVVATRSGAKTRSLDEGRVSGPRNRRPHGYGPPTSSGRVGARARWGPAPGRGDPVLGHPRPTMRGRPRTDGGPEIVPPRRVDPHQQP